MLLGIHRIGRGRGLIHLTIPIPGMVILRLVLQITQLIKFIIQGLAQYPSLAKTIGFDNHCSY